MKKEIVLVILIVGLSGCTTTQKAATVGGLTGATIGGVIGHQSGDGVKGAAIGGIVGTVGGMIVGEKMLTKFCPVGGELYTEDVQYCSTHGVELKHREQQ